MNLLFVLALALAVLSVFLFRDLGKIWSDAGLAFYRWRPPDR